MTYFGTRQPRYGLTSRTARTAYAIVLSYSGANFMLWPVAMKRLFKQGICLSGWGDLNSRPSVPQIDAPQTVDLRKRPETVSGLPFWLITGSRWFALFRDISRPVRGLTEGPRCL